MVATGVTMGLAEWIIDDTCLIILHNRNDTELGGLQICSFNKTEVINDPLGQSTIPAGSDYALFWKVWTDDKLCEYCDHYRSWMWVGLVEKSIHK